MLFRLLYQFPSWMQSLFPHTLWRADSASKTVYLTFDDGPIPEVTPQILAILRAKDVKATFFCVGDNVRKYPELLTAILADGHRVGNHTFHHLPGWQTKTVDYLQDVSEAECLIPKGERWCPLFRPPYGRMRVSQKQALLKAGYKIVLWDVLTHDYNSRYSPDKMLAIVRRYTRPGSVVVFHDSLRSNERMLKTLPRAIDFWQSQGYTLGLL